MCKKYKLRHTGTFFEKISNCKGAFYEKIKHPDDTNTDLIHIFFANDVRSEENTAANYFNNNTINFLQAQIKSFSYLKSFDVIASPLAKIFMNNIQTMPEE